MTYITIAKSRCLRTMALCLSCVTFLFISTALSAQAQQSTDMPIYGAYVSDTLAQQCTTQECQLNVFDGNQLTTIALQLAHHEDLSLALSMSEYEVLIGNAIINTDSQQNTQLVLEITTTWRSVPIDEFTMSVLSKHHNHEDSALNILQHWFSHVKENEILEASRIYEVLQASNYNQELRVPQSIGPFLKDTSAIYRDPMQGSITRYTHPQFDDAIVDISVYPVSPFGEQANVTRNETGAQSASQRLKSELSKEAAQMTQVINQANIVDYNVSQVFPSVIEVAGEVLKGYRLEILLNSQTVPVYSTLYVFLQNDKIIKLSANVPQSMMAQIVQESLPQISVPSESAFMKKMRQG